MTLRLTYIDRKWRRVDTLIEGKPEECRRKVKRWRRGIRVRQATYSQVLVVKE